MNVFDVFRVCVIKNRRINYDRVHVRKRSDQTVKVVKAHRGNTHRLGHLLAWLRYSPPTRIDKPTFRCSGECQINLLRRVTFGLY